MNNYLSLISDFLDSKEEEMIAELQKLVAIPSYNQPAQNNMPYGEDAAKCLAAALDLCDRLGLVTKNFENYVGTATLGGAPTLGILCHLDVVPEGVGWVHSPYVGTVENGNIYGRGTIDNKGPAIAALYALNAIKALNIPLKHGVRCIFGTNEECGSHDLEYYKTRESYPEMVFTPDAEYPLINIEKGQVQGEFSADYIAEIDKTAPHIVSVQSGQTINAVPSIADAVVAGFTAEEVSVFAQKINLGVDFEITQSDDNVCIHAVGVGAHASTPQKGKNALTATLALLTSMPFGDSDGFDYIKKVVTLFPYSGTCGKEIGIFCSDEKSKELTLAFSIFSYESGKISGKIDIRFPLCTSGTEVKEKLDKAFTANKFAFNVLTLCEPHETSADGDFVQKLLEVYRLETGDNGKPISTGGGTYVHHIDGGVAFGAEFPGDQHHMHGADEFIEISSLMKNAKIMAHAILSICG